MSAPSYKKLFTFWFSVFIYDLTVKFCERWIRSWKLREQMTGAARSGKQNIVEGSEGMKTSLKTGIKLTNVANASIEELIGDFEDFLRQRELNRWEKTDPRIRSFRAQSARIVRSLSDLSNLQDDALRHQKEKELLAEIALPQNSEKAGNLLLTLCHQASYLLNRQVEALEEKHRTQGGYTEKLYKRRKKYRGY